jgi:hypothetical protein
MCPELQSIFHLAKRSKFAKVKSKIDKPHKIKELIDNFLPLIHSFYIPLRLQEASEHYIFEQ